MEHIGIDVHKAQSQICILAQVGFVEDLDGDLGNYEGPFNEVSFGGGPASLAYATSPTGEGASSSTAGPYVGSPGFAMSHTNYELALVCE